MRMHLTDGKSRVTISFCSAEDQQIVRNIRKAARPVSAALGYAKERLQKQVGGDIGNWYPIPGPTQALEGV